MPVNVQDLIRQLIEQITGDTQIATQFVTDGKGFLAENGVTDQDLSGVDVRQAVGDVCADGSHPELQSYANGGSAPSHGYTPPPASAPQSVESVVQHLTYVTQVAYSDNDTITQIIEDNSVITNIDNSIDIGGDFEGDLEVENTTAVGEGAAAADSDGGDINQQTGDGVLIDIGGIDASGGDGTGGGGGDGGPDSPDIYNAAGPGGNGGAGSGGDGGNVDLDFGPITTGNQNTVVDDSNVDGSQVGTFGSGATNVNESTVTDAAVGQNALNQSNNDLDDGSALSGTGPASGHNEDNDITTTIEDNDTTTISDTDDSVIQVVEDLGQAHADVEPGHGEDKEIDA